MQHPPRNEAERKTTMKKITFYDREDDVETTTLYTGISEIDGGFILRRDYPVTLHDYEYFECDTPHVTEEQLEANEAELAEIQSMIADPSTPWEPLSEEDEEYIRYYLNAWGVN